MEPDLFDIKDDFGDCGFANPTKGEAGDSNAELDSGKKLVDGMLELQGGASAGAAKGDQLLDAGLADANQGEFRGNEEAGSQNKKSHDDYAEEHPLKH
jgi:hypothetical protein